jgi:hypothetical protein
MERQTHAPLHAAAAILPSSIAGLALIAAGLFLHGRISPRGPAAETPRPGVRQA